MMAADSLSRRLATKIALCIFVLGGFPLSSLAASLDSRLSGAWAVSEGDCSKIFQRTGGKLQFRQPVDEFKQSVIIDSAGMSGPVDQCSINSIVNAKDSTVIAMQCHNSISYFRRKIKIKIINGTEIINGFPGNDALDVTYRKCAL